MNFTRDEDEKLCELVANHPPLYDYSNSNFKDLILKDNTWKEIANSFSGKTGYYKFLLLY